MRLKYITWALLYCSQPLTLKQEWAAKFVIKFCVVLRERKLSLRKKVCFSRWFIAAQKESLCVCVWVSLQSKNVFCLYLNQTQSVSTLPPHHTKVWGPYPHRRGKLGTHKNETSEIHFSLQVFFLQSFGLCTYLPNGRFMIGGSWGKEKRARRRFNIFFWQIVTKHLNKHGKSGGTQFTVWSIVKKSLCL